MATPPLSKPILARPQDLRSDPELTLQITSLINKAFSRSKHSQPDKWHVSRLRFPNHELYYEMLGQDSVVALIFHGPVGKTDSSSSSNTISESENGSPLQRESASTGSSTLQSQSASGSKVVACAAAVPWNGGWTKEGAGKEEGWEIKAVAVDGHERFLKKGLAVQVMAALEEHLIEQTKKQHHHASDLPKGVTLWILAAECINGAYWRRRGYREVRRATEGQGTWGCKTTFDMVVFRKEVKCNP
ncbi:hypothetical protein ACEQ8H_000511 [Pleosporales sp. CAS-2024a]